MTNNHTYPRPSAAAVAELVSVIRATFPCGGLVADHWLDQPWKPLFLDEQHTEDRILKAAFRAYPAVYIPTNLAHHGVLALNNIRIVPAFVIDWLRLYRQTSSRSFPHRIFAEHERVWTEHPSDEQILDVIEETYRETTVRAHAIRSALANVITTFGWVDGLAELTDHLGDLADNNATLTDLTRPLLDYGNACRAATA